MGNIDEELIDEALNAPKKKKLPVFRITAAAAALVFIALAATVLVNINKQPNMTAESNTSNVQTSEKADETTLTEQTSKTEQSTASTPAAQTSKTEQSTASASEAPASEQPADENEGSDMLGFLVTDDGKSYMQVFNSTEYTLDKDIGRAGDFRGYY